MEAKTSKKIALWMDQSHALLVGYDRDEAHILEDLPSPIESHTREDGEGSDQTRFGAAPSDASNNEHKKHNVQNNQIKAYFQQLEKKLVNQDELLLLGPGITKTQFSNFLKENKQHDELHITVKNAEKMSDNQLVALVKEKFSENGKINHSEGDKNQHKKVIATTASDQKGKAGSIQAGTHPKDPNPSQGFGPQKQRVANGLSHQKEQPTWGDRNQPKKMELILGYTQKPPMAPRMTSQQEEE